MPVYSQTRRIRRASRSYDMAYTLIWGNPVYGETYFHRIGFRTLALQQFCRLIPGFAPRWDLLTIDIETASALYHKGDEYRARKLLWQVLEITFFLALPLMRSRAELLLEELKFVQRGQDAIEAYEQSLDLEEHYGERVRWALIAIDRASLALGIEPTLFSK